MEIREITISSSGCNMCILDWNGQCVITKRSIKDYKSHKDRPPSCPMKPKNEEASKGMIGK